MENSNVWEVTSWDHMVMDQSRSTRHQVRLWQEFSIKKSKWQTNYIDTDQVNYLLQKHVG
jgi:hypothetical protein